MAKGENIFKRKDGRWEARCVKGSKVFFALTKNAGRKARRGKFRCFRPN